MTILTPRISAPPFLRVKNPNRPDFNAEARSSGETRRKHIKDEKDDRE